MAVTVGRDGAGVILEILEIVEVRKSGIGLVVLVVLWSIEGREVGAIQEGSLVT